MKIDRKHFSDESIRKMVQMIARYMTPASIAVEFNTKTTGIQWLFKRCGTNYRQIANRLRNGAVVDDVANELIAARAERNRAAPPRQRQQFKGSKILEEINSKLDAILLQLNKGA